MSYQAAFRTPAGEAAFLAAYDAALKRWPVPYGELEMGAALWGVRLDHYLRALLGRARGESDDQVERRLRSALYSPPAGFSRINLELGHNLLRQGRAVEAAAVLSAALRRSSESNGLYTTRSEVHEMLGRAWHAAGRADSATVHYRAARSAWRAADPVLQPRVRELDRRLAACAAGSSC